MPKTRLVDRVITVATTAVFIGVFREFHIHVESVVWARYGFDPPPEIYDVLSFVMAVAPSFWLPVGARRPSDITIWFLYLTAVIPIMIMPFHVLDRAPGDVLVFTSAILLALATLSATGRIRRIPLRPLALSRSTLVLVLTGATALIGVAVFLSLPEHEFSLTIDDIYTRRLAARESVGARTALSYGLAFLSKSLTPLLIVIGTVSRRYWLIIPGLLGLILSFSIDGQRTVALLPVFLLLLFTVLKWSRKYFSSTIIVVSTLLFLLSMYLYFVHDSALLAHLFPNRLFLAKGSLTGYYWDFFSTHPYVYFSDGILSGLVEPKYPVHHSFLIGEVYYQTPLANATSNLWSSGFANLGYPGIFIMSLAAGGVLWILDSLALNRDPRPPMIVAGMLGLIWSDASFQTSLLSNGVVLTLIILYALPLAAPQTAGQSTSAKPM